MIYTKFHYYKVRFKIGPHPSPSRPAVRPGEDYGMLVKSADMHDVQAYLEKEFDAKDIMLYAETIELASLTDAEKASLVIEQL